jgi:predicted secreted protein
MSVAYGLAVYFIFWWLSLLMVLPFGVKNSHEAGESLQEGQDQGAPASPNLRKKLLWATLLSAAFFVLFVANRYFGWITIEKLPGPDKLY